jgi:YggT family protein
LITDIVFRVLFALLGLFGWAIILTAVVSTLISFGVLDTRNRLVWSVADFLYRVTEPALRPIRAVMPNFGSIDLSPLVALLLLKLVISPVLTEIYGGIRFGNWQPLF